MTNAGLKINNNNGVSVRVSANFAAFMLCFCKLPRVGFVDSESEIAQVARQSSNHQWDSQEVPRR